MGSFVSLVLLAAGTVAMVRRRRPTDAAERVAEEDSFAAAEDQRAAAAPSQSLVDFRVEKDPRRAIIGCYAQMERSLARAGMPRRLSEAPFEYLMRAVAVVEPVQGGVLTELYERAMFSQEPMSEREKVSAIKALEALQRALSAELLDAARKSASDPD